MSAQTSYNLRTAHGVAGGLYDLTDHDVDTRNNEATDGKIKFGLGVVEGTLPGKNVTLPVTTSTKAKFEGVAINSHAHEQDYKCDVTLRKGETVGVLTKGRIYVRITADAEPAYGAPLYLITDGENAGYFTNELGEGVTGIKLNGFFLDAKATDAIAPAFVFVDKVDETTKTE